MYFSRHHLLVPILYTAAIFGVAILILFFARSSIPLEHVSAQSQELLKKGGRTEMGARLCQRWPSILRSLGLLKALFMPENLRRRARVVKRVLLVAALFALAIYVPLSR